MREGEAERLRADCRAGDLICPVPDCADPRYTTVGGSKRDHFRHLNLANGVHSPETYHHFLAKQVVGDWARRTHPDAEVFVDERQVRGADGRFQVPDVLVSFPDGRRFAFEVQYAPLTIDEWRRRHLGYRAGGIVDVWLWGHERRYLRPSKHHTDRIELGPVPFAAQRAGVPLYWINPDEGLIGTARDVSDPWTIAERRSGRRGKPTWETLSLAFEPLTECRLEGEQLVTPVQRYEAEHRSEVAQELLRHRDRQRREKIQQEEARLAEARRREARRLYAQQKADEKYEERYRATVQRRFAGALDVIEVALQWDRVVYRSPAQWHAKLFELFIEGQIGTIFAFADVMDRLMSNLPGRLDEMPIAAYNYLLFLHERGFVECVVDDRRLITDVRVLADAASPPGSEAAMPAAAPLRNPITAERLGSP